MAEGVVSFGVEKLWDLLSRESERLQGVHEKVDDLKCQMRMLQSLLKDADAKKYESVSFGIQQIIYRSPSLQERQRPRENRQTYPKTSQKDLVGVEQSVKELVGHLVENDNIQVVSISGMGGIGKTTLARQVFHHDIVQSHFDGFAWICVSQDFKKKDIWQKLLRDLRPHEKGIEHMNEDTLQAKIFHLLETSKYLIVMDDVWKKEDWDVIKDVFPQARGWKMILTSRNEGVGLHADPSCFPFRPKILTPEESWMLCESIAFPRREITEFNVDEELEAMGKKMVKYCGGLPLAVKVLGGLLANKTMVEEWKRVDDNIQTQIVRIDDKSQDSVYRVLSMSYEDLPMQLKHCFLYLAHFPEDYEIQVERLYYLWEAEGIITSSGDGETTRKIGEEYIGELVRRNMVIGVKEDLSCKWEYCQMHDMMREVCLYKAKEENFLQFIEVPTSSTSTINAHTPTGSRRLAVHGGDTLGRQNNKKARSILGFGLNSNLWKQSGQGFRNLQLLRVLHLNLQTHDSDSRGGRIPSSIGKLIHLRYLSLDMGCATHVPSSLRNLKLLIYLSIFSFKRIHLPSIFKEMVELRLLMLPHVIDPKTKLELGNLVNLEYLRWFRSENGSITDLLRMKKLRNLEIYLKGRYTSEILASSLCELRNLEELCLIDENNESDGAYDVDFVWNFIHLRRLALGLHVTRLPDHSRFPPHLAHISLCDCKMEEDPLQILQKLLHLKSVELGYSAFVGRKMVCSNGGFPQLCNLEIRYLDDLEEWIVEEGSMPCLRTLYIYNCKKLKELPEGLKYITSLKELIITDKNKEWKTKLVPGGESYHKVQHIPSVQLVYDSDE
uniref:Disease resistance protein n=1 Tax=Brassica campestris TaxID=3711 RepID=M4CM36_BRACM